MDKRGIFIEIGALVLIALTSFGIFITVTASQNLYVGDSDTNNYLNYYKCKKIANNISEENLVIFNSKADAESKKYNAIEGCI